MHLTKSELKSVFSLGVVGLNLSNQFSFKCNHDLTCCYQQKIQIKTNSINVPTERWLNLVLIAFLASYGTGCYGGTIFHDWIGSPWGPKQSRWSGWSSEAAAAVARGPNHNTSTPPSTGKLDWKEKRSKVTTNMEYVLYSAKKSSLSKK